MTSQDAEPEVLAMLLARQPGHLSEAEKWRRVAEQLKSKPKKREICKPA